MLSLKGFASFFFFTFISEKFRFSDERVSFGNVGVEHENRLVRIYEALNSSDVSVNGKGDFSFNFILEKIRYSGEEVCFSAAEWEH